MQLTLTTRWRETKSSIHTFRIKKGMIIEYYGNGLDNTDEGVVIRKDKKYYIKWEHHPPTLIDLNDEKFQKIFPYLGFQ